MSLTILPHYVALNDPHYMALNEPRYGRIRGYRRRRESERKSKGVVTVSDRPENPLFPR